MRRRRNSVLALAVAVGLTAVAAAGLSPAAADVTPPTFSATLAPGGSVTVTKTVEVPAVPPKLDFVLDVDLSGSYADDLPNITALAPDLFDDLSAGVADLQVGLVTFVDYPFHPWGANGIGCGDYAYARNQDLTPDKTTWTSAVAAMTIRCGGDEPESQLESLYQAATGAGRDVPPAGPSAGDVPAGEGVSFRADATKVIAITTDASMHVAGDSSCTTPSPPCPFPYPGPTFTDTVAALNAAGIKVIALKAPGSTTQMDDLAAATGGSVQTTSASSSDIADAILAALEELTFTITASAVGCDPLDVTFSPASHTDVVGGTSVDFDETISVPDGTPGGTYSCTVEFYADDTLIGIQTIEIQVNTPPDCSEASASPAVLWPPNHKLVPISIVGVTDADGDAVTITATSIVQDEPVLEPLAIGAGATSPDGVLAPLQVRAERAGTGDGRVYRISFAASDSLAECSGTVTVGVPHDRRPGATAIDSGPPWYDSTAP
jgi:hypothetical protein